MVEQMAQVQRQLVARPARTEALADAIRSLPLTALVAPGGYGKTSLVTLALDAVTIPAARYTAELWHVGNFIEPLVEKIRERRPDFGRLTLALEQRRTQTSESPVPAARRIGATFASELGYVPEPLVIVIDDVHILSDDAFFAEFLAGTMRALPDCARIVLCGRSLPSVPFAEWLASQRTRIFDIDDIRFDDDDTRALAVRFGQTLDAAALSNLRSTYEGWAAGMALALGAPDAAVPSAIGSLPARSAFLLDANLDALDADLTAFLEATSVFDALETEVLAREPAFAAAPRYLGQLERRGVMIETVRADCVYRVHPLLREALQVRVRRREGADALAALHERAGQLLERDGRIRQALYHFEAAGSGPALTQFIGARAYESFIAGQGERIAALAARLRRQGVQAEPIFALIDGMIARQRGDPGAEDAFLRGIAAAREGDPVGRSCRLLLIEDRLARAFPIEEAELDVLLATSDGDPLVEQTVHVAAGWSAAIATDFNAALERALRARAVAGEDLVARTRIASLEAYVLTVLGDFEAADRTLGAQLRDLEPSDHVVLLANTLVWYARFALLWGDVTAARDYGERGQALASRLDLTAELAGISVALAEVYARSGERELAERACDDTRRRGPVAWYAVDRARASALAIHFGARAAFGAGDLATAIGMAESALAEGAPMIPRAQRASIAADAAAYRILADRTVRDLDLNRAAAIVREAIAFDALDAAQIAEAAAILELAARRCGQTVDAAMAPALFRTFGAFLERRTERLDRSDRFDPVLRALRPSTAEMPRLVEAPRGSTLTPREDQILRLIVLGLTNREIAQRLVVSPRTVDTHVERVLSKLGVSSRTRAVATALRLGLVASP